ncbi:MAG: hypothetical protein OXB94_04245 [Nitrospira sp.]|nr:hypothetical protein [Nitrospira sp.]
MPPKLHCVHSQGRDETHTRQAEKHSSESLIFPSGRTGLSGERRTPGPTGMPGTTALTHAHQCPPFLQVKRTKPLADGFSWTINAQAGFLVAPLISLLPCHKAIHQLAVKYIYGALLILVYTANLIFFKLSVSDSGQAYMIQCVKPVKVS